MEQNTLTFQFRDVVGQAVEVLKVYTQDRVHQRQIVDFPVPAGGGPQLPDPGASASAFPPGELDQGVFLQFSSCKKSARVAASPSARVRGHSGSRAPAACGAEELAKREAGRLRRIDKLKKPWKGRGCWTNERGRAARTRQSGHHSTKPLHLPVLCPGFVADTRSCVSRAGFGILFWFSTGRRASDPAVDSVLLSCGAILTCRRQGGRLSLSSTSAVVCTCWFAGSMHLVLCFLLVSSGSRCSVSWPVWTRLAAIHGSGMCSAGLAGTLVWVRIVIRWLLFHLLSRDGLT